MTYEEKAEEYIKNVRTEWENQTYWVDCTDEVKQAYLDGLAEGRKEKWHDLRKDPNDLPKENGKYIIHIKLSEIRSITDTCDFFNGFFGQYINPTAWCELPQFKE